MAEQLTLVNESTKETRIVLLSELESLFIKSKDGEENNKNDLSRKSKRNV